MAVLQSQLKLSLLDQVSGPARRISGVLRGLTASAKAQAGMFSGLTGKIAMMTGGAASIYGVARGFKTAVSSAADFQTAMNRVSALSGSTSVEMKKMREQALELGRTTMFTASQAGDAQGFLAMAGFKANDIMAAMPGTLQLATAAQMDLARTADVVTNILTGYNMEVSELGRVNDVLVKAFTSANVDLTMLAESMKYAGPIATSAGIQFEEATAALSLMGNAGIQGSMAGTSLRGAMTRVLNPTKAIRTAMKQAGLSFTDAEGRLLPLADIVERLEPHVENTGLFMEIFGQRAGPAMAALVTQGSRKLRELDRELRNSGGTAERVANVRMQGFNGRMLEMRSAAEGFMIAWGDRIIPHLTPMVERFTRLFGELTEFMGTLDSRVSVLDRMAASFKNFAAGLGFADAGDMLNSWRQFFVDGLFGTTEGFHKDVEDMGRTAHKMRQIGADIRAFIDDMTGANLAAAMGSLWDVFKDMPTLGKMAVLWSAGGAIKLLAAASFALVNSPFMRAAFALWTFATVLEMFTSADSLTSFVDSLKELSGLEFAGLAIGLGLIGAKLWRILRGLRGISRLGGIDGALGKGKSNARTPTKSPVPEASPSGGGFWGALGLSSVLGFFGTLVQGLGDTPGATFEDQVANQRKAREQLQRMLGMGGSKESTGRAHLSTRDDGGRSRALDSYLDGPPLPPTTLPQLNVPTGMFDKFLEGMRNLGQQGDPLVFNSMPGAPAPTGMFDKFLEGMRNLAPPSDPIPTLESIRDQVGMAPTGTHDVREINPTPVHAPINVTVYATTNADPNQIASQVGAKVQDQIAGYYGTSAYG